MARFMIQCIVLFSRQTAEEVKPENGLEALVNEKHYIVKVVKLNPWLTWNLMALLWPEIERFCLFEVVTLKWEEWEAQSAHDLFRNLARVSCLNNHDSSVFRTTRRPLGECCIKKDSPWWWHHHYSGNAEVVCEKSEWRFWDVCSTSPTGLLPK